MDWGNLWMISQDTVAKAHSPGQVLVHVRVGKALLLLKALGLFLSLIDEIDVPPDAKQGVQFSPNGIFLVVRSTVQRLVVSNTGSIIEIVFAVRRVRAVVLSRLTEQVLKTRFVRHGIVDTDGQLVRRLLQLPDALL